MKMKKLLSIGALVLVLASSTSIGASAATIPNELMNKKSILNLIENQYKNGTNPVGLLEDVDKETTIGELVKFDVTTEFAEKFSSRPVIYATLKKIINNKNNTISTVLNKATTDVTTFSKFKTDFLTIANKIQEMDAIVGPEREKSETTVISIVKLYDNKLDVTFGKDSLGKTIASIKKSGQVVIQINSADFQKILNIVNELTLKEVKDAIS